MNPQPEISPLPTPEFRPAPDLTDPTTLIRECESMATGMAQQSAASRINSAMGGHPNPSYFFGSAAVLFKAAAEMIKKLAPKPKVEDKGETRPTPSPAPAAKTETKTETKPEPKPEPAKTDKK